MAIKDKMSKENNSFYALKCIAFLGIFFLHSKFYIEWAALGVSIFFVLSGFLLSQKYGVNDVEAGWTSGLLFAWKHIKKIYVLHIITMLMVLPLDTVLKLHNDFSLKTILIICRNLFLNIFLIQSWWPSSSVNVSLNGVAWYLSSIAFCYFCFPSIIYYLKNRKRSFIIGSLVIVLFAQFGISYIASVIGVSENIYRWLTYDAPFFRLGDFYIGCVAGIVTKRNQKEEIIVKTLEELLVIILAITVVLWDRMFQHDSVISHALNNWTTIYIPLAVAIIILIFHGSGLITKLITNRIMIYIGKNSSYYFLLHYVLCKYVLNVLLFIRLNINPWILSFGLLLLTVFLTYIYQRIEKRLRNKRVEV